MLAEHAKLVSTFFLNLVKLRFTNSYEQNYSQVFLTILVSGTGYSLNAQIRVNMNFKDKIVLEISQCLL